MDIALDKIEQLLSGFYWVTFKNDNQEFIGEYCNTTDTFMLIGDSSEYKREEFIIESNIIKNKNTNIL